MKIIDVEQVKQYLDNELEKQVIEIDGEVKNSPFAYQRTSTVKPIQVKYSRPPEPEYIKYVCPVCKILGNKHQLPKGIKNCPLCNVNLTWNNIK